MQARSFHYHSEKALHETLPGKQGRLLVIFLPYYCQNLLYFTFYSQRSFSYYIPIAFFLSLSHLNAEMFGVLLLSAHTYNYWFLNVVHIKASTKKKRTAPNVKIICRSNVAECNCNQMLVFMSNEPLALDLDLLSKVSQHA